MAIAVISLLGILVASYLTLYKMGIIGTLTCSVGSCETVNTSKWAVFVGAPVAAWGVGFYVTTFAVALASIQPRWEDSRGASLLLTALSGWGVIFSAWLTYLELYVINAICMWCVISAILVVLMFGVSLWDLRDRRAGAQSGAEAA
jgi:uncharacterized membrane protein